MSSAISFNLDQSKILSSANGLHSLDVQVCDIQRRIHNFMYE